MSHGLGFFAAFWLWVAPSAVVYDVCRGPSAVADLWVGSAGGGVLTAQLLCGGVVLRLLFCGWF